MRNPSNRMQHVNRRLCIRYTQVNKYRHSSCSRIQDVTYSDAASLMELTANHRQQPHNPLNWRVGETSAFNRKIFVNRLIEQNVD